MLVAVGGDSRDAGTASVVAGLIRKLRPFNWTAVKITGYERGGACSKPCQICSSETGPNDPRTIGDVPEPNTIDSGRFLAAGATRSFRMRMPGRSLMENKAALRKILDQNENVIIESNSVLDLIEPDLFLMLLDFSSEDFDPSVLRYMDRADAFLVIDRGFNSTLWDDVSRGVWDRKPQFLVKPPTYVTAAVCDFVRSRFSAGPAH